MKLYSLENGKITVSETIENFSFDKNCDILCVGAGSAGVYASDSAAREGSDVILLENSTCIGGMHVRGNVCMYYYGDEGGSYLEDESQYTREVFLAGNQQPEMKQTVLYKRLKKSGVKVLCKHCPIGVYMEDNRVVGLRVLSDNGILSIGAKMVIDSTSDGHIIRMCPVEKTYGRKIDGKTVPFTVRTQYFANRCFMSINADSGYTNQYIKEDFSKKTILAHANAARYIEKGEFINVAFLTGIREGLSFEGEEKIEYTDIILDKPCEKTLFYAYSDLDKHGHDFALDEEMFQNWLVISNLGTVTSSIAVPMGCVIPKNIKGIVTAGRCISSDPYSLSSIRMNRDMFRMGECVGIATSMAVKNQCDFNEIDYDTYLEKVKARGCFKSDKDRKFGFDNSRLKEYIPVEFNVEKNLHLLETTTPGVIIWSCFVAENREKTTELIYNKLISSDNDLEKYNCAIALGIMKDKRITPVLREIIENRDDFCFTDCRRSNQLRTSIAICLLGRLGAETDVDILEEIVFGENEFKNQMYEKLITDISGDYNPVYFDVFTHACMSLIKLYKTYNLNTKLLHGRLEELFREDKIIKRVTNAEFGNPHYMEIYDFQKYVLKITE